MLAMRRPTKAFWRGALLFAIVALSHGLYAHYSVKVPYVFGDEAGYLLKAAALTGQVTDAYSSYYPAYALLIAPLFLLSKQPLHVFHAVQCLNALLAGLSALLMYRVARRCSPATSRRRAWLAALVVSFYPSFMAFSSFALSENLFVPLALLLALSTLRYARRPGYASAVLLGATCGILALAHPKGVMTSLAAMLAMLPIVRERRRFLDLAVVAAATALVFAPLWLALDAFFRLRLGQVANDVNGHYPDASGMVQLVSTLASAQGLHEVLQNLLGQAFYLGVSSLGLAVLGFGRLFMQACAPAEPGQDKAIRSYAIYAVAACLATMAMTALFMHRGERVDQRFYGRYDEGIVALLMLPPLVAPLRARAWLVASGLILLAGLTSAWSYGDVLHGWLVEINVIGMQLWRWLPGQIIGADGMNVLAIALATAALMLPIARLARNPALAPVLLLLFLATSAVASQSYLRPTSNQHARQHAIATYVKRHYPAVSCVNYDRDGADYWARFNYQFFLLPLRLHETTAAMRPPAGSPPCSDLMITSAELQQSRPSAKLLLRERTSPQALWQIPR